MTAPPPGAPEGAPPSGATPHLNRRHTIFGQVADEQSAKVVDSIAATPTGPGDRPREDVVVERVEIERA